LVYNGAVKIAELRARYSAASASQRQLLWAVALLLLGLIVVPLLIYVAGVNTLGRYEGAGLWHLYATLYKSLASGAPASWIVVLGPNLLLWLAQGLRFWWRRSARLAA
jgi:hypothetical protein